MAADKMIGMGYVEGEPDITKLRVLWKDSWVLFAGDDIPPVFDVIDRVKQNLSGRGLGTDRTADLPTMMWAVQAALEGKRIADAVAVHLTPLGWTLPEFNSTGYQTLPNAAQIQENLQRYTLSIHLLVAGFHEQEAYLFDVYGDDYGRGIPRRRDIPGFQAIGSGATVANFMMFYRGLSPSTGAREATYYALEAKYYGEQASGVGPDTDIFVAKPGQELVRIKDERIEEQLIPICRSLEPRELTPKHRKALNAMSELSGFADVEPPKKHGKQQSLSPPPTAPK